MGIDSGALHERTFVMDGLSPSGLTEEYVTETLPDAGVDAKHETVASAGDTFRSAIESVLRYQQDIEAWPGVYQARSVEELRGTGLGIVFGFQDTTAIEDRPDLIRVFDQLGIRIVQLTYNSRNLSGNGCTERVDDGLSKYGLKVIDAIESNDLLLDLSHAGPKTAVEALDVANQPTVFSHSNPNAVHSHPWNVSDELIEAVAAKGGFVGVNAFPDIVAANDPTVADLVDHVEYLRDLVGFEHVTLGLDFIDNRDVESLPFLDDPEYSDPPLSYPDRIESAADIPNITTELVDRGFAEEEIRGIMGENLLRVYDSVW